MKPSVKKLASLLMAVIMAVIALPLSAQAAEQKPEPHMAVSMSLNSDLPSVILGGETVTVKATFISVMGVTGEPVTITATNGGVIQPSSIVYKANGSVFPVKSLSINGGTATFITGVPAANPLPNEISFQVKMPVDPTVVDISVKIGLDGSASTPGVNYVSKAIEVVPKITISSTYQSGPEGFYGGGLQPGIRYFGDINVPGAAWAVVTVSSLGGIAYETMVPVTNKKYTTVFINDANLPGTFFTVTVTALNSGLVTIATRSSTYAGQSNRRHTVKTNLRVNGALVESLAETYVNGWVFEIKDGGILTVGGADYEILTAKINDYTVPDGKTRVYFITGTTTVELTGRKVN